MYWLEGTTDFNLDNSISTGELQLDGILRTLPYCGTSI